MSNPENPENTTDTKKMNKLYQFFCWAGGGNIEVLQEMPTEQNRFFGYGTVICMTAIFATLSSGYAFSLLMDDKSNYFILLVPALAWGTFIFVLDRFFIVTISNAGSFWGKFLRASPRLLLAIFIGMLISKPIEFRIFQREINDELGNIKIDEARKNDSVCTVRKNELDSERETEIQNFENSNPNFNHWNSIITKLDKRIDFKDSAAFAQSDSVDFEYKGIAKSHIKGPGPQSKEHQKNETKFQHEKDSLIALSKSYQVNLDSLVKTFDTVIKNIRNKYALDAQAIDTEKQKKNKDLEENYKPSILNQQIALSKIGEDKSKPSAAYTIWFISILFIFIEMAPMLLKLMTSAGVYENRIAQIEAGYSTDGRLRRSLDLEEYKSNRELVQRLARSQRKIISTALDGWHHDEMERMKEDPEYRNNNLFNENNTGNDSKNEP